MLTIDVQSLSGFFQTNWGWAAGLAASMLALTGLAGALLHPDRKVELALWLQGAESEENWSKSFISLFDTVFGARHLSFRCLWRSAAASQVAMTMRGCDGGMTKECVGRMVAYILIMPDHVARLWWVACRDGGMEGCSGLGFLHEMGYGVAEDLAEATRLYRRGCDLGHAQSRDRAKRLAADAKS